MLAYDEGVGGHDAALEQAEQRRHHIERHQPLERQEQQQRHGLQRGSEQQRAQAADVVGDPSKREPADDAETEHDREHLRAARGAVAQVAAIGDDVHLRHGHGHAAGDPGHAQQCLQGARRESQRTH